MQVCGLLLAFLCPQRELRSFQGSCENSVTWLKDLLYFHTAFSSGWISCRPGLIANCVEKIENLESNVNLEHLEWLVSVFSSVFLGSCRFHQHCGCFPHVSVCLGDRRLYQNLLKKIENISHLHNLNVLDLSFNKIRSMENLRACNFPRLERLYLSSNKITDALVHKERPSLFSTIYSE